MVLVELVYLSHDNSFSLAVKESNIPVDLVAAGVTRVVVNYTDTQIDSNIEGEGVGQPFDWVTDGASGIIKFNFGTLSLGIGKHTCTLTIFDPAHVNGQVWGDGFYMDVKAQVVT